jgi:hypothetical protein
MTDELDGMTITDNAETGEETTDVAPEESTELEESAPSEETPEEKPEEKKVEPGVVKRIGKLTARYYTEKNRADTAEKKLAEMQQQPVVSTKKAPTLEDFDYDEDKYNQALIDHRVDSALSEREQKIHSQKAQVEASSIQDGYNKKVSESGLEDEVYDAFSKLSDAKIPLGHAVDAIQMDDNGPAITVFLGNNLEEADKIAGMNPVQAALEIGRISAKLSAVKTKKTTKAPDPVKPAGGSSVAITKDIASKSMEDIMSDDSI